MNIWTVLKEKILDKECFYRPLKDGTTGDNGEKLNGHISDKQYLTYIKISNKLSMKNLGDYYDHYLKKDVLLLAIFEKFTDTCLKFYKLDSYHYFSYPWLSWDVMLKVTGVGLEKISDIDIYLFIEKRLRGGILCLVKDIVKQKLWSYKTIKIHIRPWYW